MRSEPAADRIRCLPADAIDAALRAEMERIVARYYREAAAGLRDELRFGDRVYCLDGEAGGIGAFLVVNLDHHRATIGGRLHQFTYLGLGCADGAPMPPVFRRARDDHRARLAPGARGVLHLTTRTPFAIAGLEKAFPGGIVPRASHDDAGESEIAAHLKAVVHRHPERGPGESPFVLRQLKKGRFGAAEVERIRSFRGSTALGRLGIDCEGEDEAIVFHAFDPSP